MATPKLEANGKTYGIRCSFIDLNGNKIQKYKGGFRNKKEALNWAITYVNQNKQTNNNISTFYELIDYFLLVKKSSKLQPITIADYEYYCERIKKDIPNCMLSNITTPNLQMYLNSHDTKPCYQKHIKQTLSAIFTLAYNQNILATNPFSKVIKPQYIQKEIKIYNSDEINQLLSIFKQDALKYYPYVLLLAGWGLRPNEATALKEEDIIQIDNEYYLNINKNISIVKNRVDGSKKEYIKEPKTNAGKRILPITKELIKELNSYKRINNIKSEYVLCDENGDRLLLNSFAQALKRIIKKYNLPYITPYGLRHSFGNLNKSLGNDSYTVSKLMGHSDPSITEKYYYHNDIKLNKQSMNKVLNIIKTK